MTPPSQTALERAVTAGEPRARVTPLDALNAARRMWLTDMRIDMGALAGELGVSRATLYNWVGDRERLTGEVLWSIAERTIEQGRQEARGSGPDYISAVVEHYLTQLALFEPTRRFIERDPEFALRVLTGNRTPFQRRLIETVQAMIEEQTSHNGYRPPLDAETLAYLLVRIGESFIFNNLITGSEPDLHKAVQASRVLLHAPPLPHR
ncbi:MAG: QsdR family transcriptional regulator [Solirubrobacteraceae bacterium]